MRALNHFDYTRAKVPDELMEYVNPYQLDLWRTCPRSFARQFVDEIEPAATAAQLLEQLVRAALASYYHLRQINLLATTGDILFRLDRLFEEILEENNVRRVSSAEIPAILDGATALLSMYLEHELVRGEIKKPLAVEMWFGAPLLDPDRKAPGLALADSLDLVLEDEAGPRLVIWEVLSGGLGSSDNLRAIQLAAHSLLIQDEWGVAESATEFRRLVLAEKPRYQVHHYPPCGTEARRALLELARRYREGLLEQRFDCRTCIGPAGCSHSLTIGR